MREQENGEKDQSNVLSITLTEDAFKVFLVSSSLDDFTKPSDDGYPTELGVPTIDGILTDKNVVNNEVTGIVAFGYEPAKYKDKDPRVQALARNFSLYFKRTFTKDDIYKIGSALKNSGFVEHFEVPAGRNTMDEDLLQL